jgi:hypothetical protein
MLVLSEKPERCSGFSFFLELLHVSEWIDGNAVISYARRN